MKRLYCLDINNTCNNNCIGCANPTKRNQNLDYFVKKLSDSKKQGYNELLLSGGEPTIIPDFFRILDFGSSLFKKIYLMSNGRIFMYNKFTHELKKYALEEIVINLNGHNKNIHESWTRTPNSFFQTVRGVRNLIENQFKVILVFVIWNGNHRYIEQYLKLAQDLKVPIVRIANLLPVGNAEKNYNKISIEYSEIDFDILKKHSTNFEKIEIEDFPICVIPDSLNNISKKNIVIKNTCRFIFNQDGRIRNYPGLFLLNENIDINDIEYLENNVKKLKEIAESSFKKIDKCNNCTHTNECLGFYTEYMKLYEPK